MLHKIYVNVPVRDANCKVSFYFLLQLRKYNKIVVWFDAGTQIVSVDSVMASVGSVNMAD